ncbi:hypothetical protein J6590_018538 [Homalodisca vitripennis]|nr:hypothetical protein J6590_018538 [Homalodisca vitripennis]
MDYETTCQSLSTTGNQAVLVKDEKKAQKELVEEKRGPNFKMIFHSGGVPMAERSKTLDFQSYFELEIAQCLYITPTLRGSVGSSTFISQWTDHNPESNS